MSADPQDTKAQLRLLIEELSVLIPMGTKISGTGQLLSLCLTASTFEKETPILRVLANIYELYPFPLSFDHEEKKLYSFKAQTGNSSVCVSTRRFFQGIGEIVAASDETSVEILNSNLPVSHPRIFEGRRNSSVYDTTALAHLPNFQSRPFDVFN